MISTVICKYSFGTEKWEEEICKMKNARATSRVNWLKREKTYVSRTISVLIFRVLMYLKNQSMSDIGLHECCVHYGALASGDCWFVSRACCVRPAS
jgi:hypothetical protein